MNESVILFPSSSYAIYAKRVLKKMEIILDLIPVPRQFSSSCGICGKIDSNKKNDAIKILENNSIAYEKFYDLI